MIPITSIGRIEMSGGAWTNKMGGEFQEGDSTTKFFFEGRADIKELGGHLRIFFKDIAIVKRPFVVSEAQMTAFREQYKVDRRERRVSAYGEENADESSDDEDDVKLEKENKAIHYMIQDEKNKPMFYPKLSLFLTAKKPKTRMVDAHKTGCKIFLGTTVDDVVFGKEGAVMTYQAPLRDIADASGFQGLVVLKLPQDEPVTEDPVVYSLIKLQSYRTMKKRTIDALHLSTLTEELTRILHQAGVEMPGKMEVPPEPVVPMDKKAKSKAKPKEPEPVIPVIAHSGTENIKALSTYRKLASKTFLQFEKLESDEIDFALFSKMINHLNIFLIQVQAIRVFNAVDIKKSHMLGISEFENALMVIDLLGSSGADLVVLDVFDSLKALPLNAVLNNVMNANQKATQVMNNVGSKLTTIAEHATTHLTNAAIVVSQTVVDPDAQEAANAAKVKRSSVLSNASATRAAIAASAAPKVKLTGAEIARNNIIALLDSCNNSAMGMDYSAFCEGIQMLGVSTSLEDDVLREAFCFGAGCKVKDLDAKYMNLSEFRKAWLKVANIDEEMKKRGMKFESGVFAEARNRDRLTRWMQDIESTYLSKLQSANEVVDTVKHDRRIKKDKHRSEQEAHRAKLLHEANKFIAIRGQEKRLLIKKEQEERSKKRTEDKVLRNKLLLRQQENLQAKRIEIAEANKIKEKLRISEIKALGLDKIDKSVQALRKISADMYTSPEAQTYLQYAVLVDFSHNVIDALPTGVLLYWMTECKKLKFSENRLRFIPDDIEHMTNLEILELDTNRIECLPDGMCQLTNLQRLDISNNQLTALPNSLGNCGALKYFCAHSNHLTFLPTSMGQCFRLEYIDTSRNMLMELPEDFQHLGSLTHLDCNSNRLGLLPHFIGSCSKLAYVDISTNQLATLPNSMSLLTQLEYMNLENNNIVTTKDTFNGCIALKYLNLRKNKNTIIHYDVGFATALNFIDYSVNNITSLPLEIGLLTLLQELKLNRNALTTLPPELGSCVRLQRLEIPYNQIEGCLPATIGLIHSLVYLDISFNNIDELPRSIIGLNNLTELRAERCYIHELPDTITYLDKLQIMDLSNNKFRRFPIELQHMKGLKVLNLANNAIELLQREINVMTILETLDLSRNRLLALPVEFTDIFESVLHVHLNENPWSLLPPRWGKLWPGTNATQGPQGYSLSEAVDFLYGMKSFYATAEKIWTELGVFHYAQRLGFEDFLQELRIRIPKSWHEGLIEYAKYLYFKSRETGIFVRWYSVDATVKANDKLLIEADSKRRDKNVQRSRDELEMKTEMGKMIYSGDMNRKIRQINDLTTEHEKNKDFIQHLHSVALFDEVKKRERKFHRRNERREKNFARLQETEMTRLKEILDADKEGREDEKAAKKKHSKSVLLGRVTGAGNVA